MTTELVSPRGKRKLDFEVCMGRCLGMCEALPNGVDRCTRPAVEVVDDPGTRGCGETASERRAQLIVFHSRQLWIPGTEL